jgi:ethanolamine utilization protein
VNIDEIVEKVTELVYQQLSEHRCKRVYQIPACKKVVIMSDHPVTAIEEALSDGYSLNYYSEKDTDSDIIIIPSLSATMMANIAAGIARTSGEEFLLTMLLQGKRVIALTDGLEYKQYKKTAPILFYKMYEEMEHKLEGYGIVFTCLSSLRELANIVPMKPAIVQAEKDSLEIVMKEETASQKCVIIDRKLITEVDLRNVCLKSQKLVEVRSDAIITPLAKDYIRTNKLTIIRG